MKRILFQSAVTITVASNRCFVVASNFTSTFSQYGCTITKMSCGFIVTNFDPTMISYNANVGCLVSAGNSQINDMPVRTDNPGSSQTTIFFTDKFENNMQHVIPGGTEFEIELSIFGNAEVSSSSNLIGTLFVWFEYDENVDSNLFGR